jgi:hypothetical protein
MTTTAKMSLMLRLTICCGLLTGCLPHRDDNRLAALDASIKTFAKLMRWGEYDSVADYLRSRDGTPTAVSLAQFKSLRITRFEVASQTMATTGDKAQAHYRIEYYREEAGIVRSLQYDQSWWHDAEAKRWFSDTALPAFE